MLTGPHLMSVFSMSTLQPFLKALVPEVRRGGSRPAARGGQRVSRRTCASTSSGKATWATGCAARLAMAAAECALDEVCGRRSLCTARSTLSRTSPRRCCRCAAARRVFVGADCRRPTWPLVAHEEQGPAAGVALAQAERVHRHRLLAAQRSGGADGPRGLRHATYERGRGS
jgi:hypothetical protein